MLLAPGQVAATTAQKLFQDREKLKDFIRDVALGLRQAGKTCFEVLAHGQKGKDIAPLRHVADPFAGKGLRRKRAERLIFQPDFAA